jgi:hypothetical protein
MKRGFSKQQIADIDEVDRWVSDKLNGKPFNVALLAVCSIVCTFIERGETYADRLELYACVLRSLAAAMQVAEPE